MRPDDIVVRILCTSHGIHGGHKADDVTRVVTSDDEFVIPWAYRGLSPIGCSLNVYHPRYVVGFRSLGDEFSQQLGTIELETWEAFLDHGPTDPPMHSAYVWPVMELQKHLRTLQNYYIPTFEEGPERKALGRHVPALHAIFRRALATGAFGSFPNLNTQTPMKSLRAIEDAVSFPGAMSALHEAVSKNDGARVRRIIKDGAFLEGWGKKGQGALLFAAREGHTEAVIALTEGGAPIDAVSYPQGATPLAAALSKRHWNTAAALIARGASLNVASIHHRWIENAMCGTSHSGDAASLQVFLDAGINVDIAPSNGVTPLMCAAKGNQSQTVALLIKAGADVNARASHNRSALRHATSGRYAEVITILKDAGARN